MPHCIHVALSVRESLFRKGLEFIINSYPDFKIVSTAKDPAQLNEFMSNFPGKTDIILLDMGLNGPDLLLNHRTKYKHLHPQKTILLSGHYQDSFILKAIEAGAASIVSKDIDPDELAYTIRQVVGHGPFFSRSLLKTGVPPDLRKDQVIDLQHVSFTKREKEILQFICEQYTTSQIAEELYISPRTVDGHRNKLLEKTSSKNTAGLVVFAIQNKIVDVGSNKKRS